MQNELRDKLIELLSQYFNIGDCYAYNLTKDKSAFGIGTMSLDDFAEFDDDTISDIVDYLIEYGVIVSSCEAQTMKLTKNQIYRSINKAKKEIERFEQLNKVGKLSTHGHWSLGYWRGRLSVLEDLLEEDVDNV